MQIKKNKPWYKKIWVWIVIILIALAIIGNSNKSVDSAVKSKTISTINKKTNSFKKKLDDYNKKAKEKAKKDLKDKTIKNTVKNMTILDAYNYLRKENKKIKMYYSQDTMKNAEVTDLMIDAGGAKAGGYAEHWKISDVLVDNDTFTLLITNPKKEAEKEEINKIGGKILTACDDKAEQMFPYGHKLHNMFGVIRGPEKLENGNYIYEVKATVTNEYNAKRKVIISCEVSGTDESMEVVNFDVN